MKCESSGDIYVNSAVSRAMTMSLLSDSEPLMNVALCPNSSYPASTMCDCYFENPSQTDDVLIIMQSVNENDEFNSYHCYIWGVNVCAWGANNNNLNDGGGCYFILPAGAMYNCSMQWGSTAFLESTAIKLDGTIYTKEQELNTQIDVDNVSGTKLPDSRSINEMILLWNKWKKKYSKIYSSKN
eukprot:243579_1